MTYKKLLSYGRSIHAHWGEDYVQDLWLSYYLSTGRDVLKEKLPNNWFYKSLVRRHTDRVRSKYRSRSRHPVSFIRVREDEEDRDSGYLPAVDNLFEEISANDLDRVIVQRLSKYGKGPVYYPGFGNTFYHSKTAYRALVTYAHLKLGYNQKEISKMWGVTQPLIRYYIKLIKDIIDEATTTVKQS